MLRVSRAQEAADDWSNLKMPPVNPEDSEVLLWMFRKLQLHQVRLFVHHDGP